MPASTTVQKLVTDPSPSQLQLMEAAELLIARHGMEGASSRAIIRYAGHRNNSAITYYFGSREALLDSIYYWRSTAVNGLRTEMMDELVAAGKQRDPESLVRAFVIPYATELERLRPSAWARYTVASLARRPLVFMEELRVNVRQYDGIELPLTTTLDLLQMMRNVACGGCEPDAGRRVAIVTRTINMIMATWEADVEARQSEVVPIRELAEEAVRLGTLALQA